jgi:hypothetical protein
MQTFGRWHSGEFANGAAGAAFAGRISWARPQFAVPVAHLSYLDFFDRKRARTMVREKL